MPESLLLSFLENVYSKNVDFCVICLRTADERRLEMPFYVKALSNLPFNFTRENHKACYICEKQAASAFKYRTASNRAAFALSTLETLKKSRLRQDMVRHGTAPPSCKVWLSKVLECESKLLEVRERSQLLVTEVLVISSNTPMHHPQPRHLTISQFEDVVEPVGPGHSNDIYVVPDNVPSEITNDDTVIICDDDIISIESEDIDPLNNSQKNTKNTMKTNKHTTIKPKTIQLAPIQNLLERPTVGEMALLDANTIIETNSEYPTNYTLHPVISKDGVNTVPSLESNLINDELIQTNILKKMLTENLKSVDTANVSRVVDSDCPKTSANIIPPLYVLTQTGLTKCLMGTPTDSSLPVLVLGDLSGNVRNQDTAQYHNPSKYKSKSQYNNPSTHNSTSKYNPANTVRSLNGPQIMSAQSLPNMNPAQMNAIRNMISSPNTNSGPNIAIINNPSPSNPACRKTDGRTTRSDRIDWEDKIPMDVISLVEESDNALKRPRYSAVTLQTPGICNVTSLNEDFIDLSWPD